MRRRLIPVLVLLLLLPIMPSACTAPPGPVTPGETTLTDNNALLLSQFAAARKVNLDLRDSLVTLRQQGMIRPNRAALITRAMDASDTALADMERAAHENDPDAYARADVDLSKQNAVLRRQLRELTAVPAPTPSGGQ